MNRITVEVVKLPTARRNVQLYTGDTVARALVEAFGEGDYSKYTIAINGSEGTLNTQLSNQDVVTISAMIKGN